jgi:hypothetical protein
VFCSGLLTWHCWMWTTETSHSLWLCVAKMAMLYWVCLEKSDDRCDYQKLSIHVEGARDRRGWRCHVPLPPLSLSLPIGRKSTEPHTRRQSNALLACIGLRVLLREGSNRPAKNSSLSVLPHFISFFTALSLSPFSLSSRERETHRPAFHCSYSH